MIFKEKLIKTIGISKLFQPLINDLKELENGIFIGDPIRKKAQMGILAYSADNLEAHQLGGFSMCFSSKDICRWCHCEHSDLVERIHDYEGETRHKYWKVREYDRICDTFEEESEAEEIALDLFAETDDNTEEEDEDNETDEEYGEVEDEIVDEVDIGDEDEVDDEIRTFGLRYEEIVDEVDLRDENDTFGLRYRCPLNKLKSFHACLNFPPDAMHDLMEGVIAQDLYGVIKIMVEKGFFTVQEYNVHMRRIGFYSYEAADRPQDVPDKAKKLPGKACSLWVHMRNFPLIIKSLMKDEADDEDGVLQLALKLLDVTNRIAVVEFRQHEIDVLEEEIINYLDSRKGVFEKYPNLIGKVRPKHHFLVHYGQAIRLFGPPLAFWTARFESKHRTSKNIAETAKNFKNISYTLSFRQQMRMASVYYRGMFQTHKFIIPEKAIYKKDFQTKDRFWVKLREFLGEDDIVCGEIVNNHQKYKNGDIVVTNLVNGVLEVKVGLIEAIVVKNNSVWLVTRKFSASRQPLGYFESEVVETESTFTEADKLVDKKPLIKHGTASKFQFVLHHHISFNNY